MGRRNRLGQPKTHRKNIKLQASFDITKNTLQTPKERRELDYRSTLDNLSISSTCLGTTGRTCVGMGFLRF